jgi:hypothetical protein
MNVSWNKSKKKLAILWFLFSSTIFFLLLAQTILGRYGDDIEQVWGWFLPTIMPTLSMITGVLIIDVVKKKKLDQEVDRFFFRLSFTLSFFYLFTVILTILLQPFAAYDYAELMELSNLWLAPFQGLVGASLGVFFVSKQELAASVPV